MAYSEESNTPRFQVYNKNRRINSECRALKPNRTTQLPCYKKDVFIMNAF
jgi:hypothetical protein